LGMTKVINYHEFCAILVRLTKMFHGNM